MFRRALLVGHDLVEIPAGETHHAFVDRNGVEGIRIRMRSDRVSVNLGILATPEEFPEVFSQPDADQEVLIHDAEDWLRAHPALRVRYPSGFDLDWYL